jgi:DNA-binding FadR family transcriptional regulator
MPVSISTQAAMLARAVEQEIVDLGWPVGRVLGSEAELMQRYQVSRPVMRETVRVLQDRSVAKTRTGPGGGLTVIAPDAEAVRDAARRYLDYLHIEPAQLYRAWSTLEVLAVTDLAENIDEAGIGRLRQALDDEKALGGTVVSAFGDVHREIARLAGNPAIELFFQVIIDLSLEHGLKTIDEKVVNWLHRKHAEIVEAIAAHDGARAAALVRSLVERLMSMGSLRRTPSP